jgi:hypothetical protein
MGWDEGPRIDGGRDPNAVPARPRGGIVPPLFWVLFILFDLVILAAVLLFILVR